MEQPNLSYIKKISKGEIEFEQTLLEIINEELSGEIDNYYKFLQENNFEKAKFYIHRIKHKMSILGLEKSYEITNVFEKSIKKGDFKNKEYFESILPIMLKFLQKL
ncbi:Hpt domain-containing protein [uncultured Polaribacter sp.]|uniref:Hpt domain-containing protein n=1 Tax=uncultured Polaribacter sp. TaxID=174711 RepID=UPI0026191106|nr:Hpt domain-containing protein [uncultured Polaribacter sp.]